MIAYLAHVVRSKGPAGVPGRAVAIGRNFGLTEARIAAKLEVLGELTARYQAPLTACVTACLVARYPAVVEAMRRRGWEVAAHGKVHCDFRQLSEEEQAHEMEEALGLCRNLALEVCGFRAPYLAWDEATRRAAAKAGFLWTSNQALLWPVLDRSKHSQSRWESFERVLDTLYRPRLAGGCVSVPRLINGVVEIPVSLPDDEILLDRLKVNESALECVWRRLFEESRRFGELAVLLIHHERMAQLAGPLEGLLASVSRLGRAVWLVDLGTLARWWLERSAFFFRVSGGPPRFEVEAACSGRAAVRLKEAGRWREVEERRFSLESALRPTIGTTAEVAPEALDFLRQEGFAVESRRDGHGLVLEGPRGFGAGDERELLEAVERAPGPLLRFWRWPHGVESALALSMDVDSITLLDFLRRALRR
jgi:peptidoglycan/xylan/chitin deacetylase (PgdA/CDA1 family)